MKKKITEPDKVTEFVAFCIEMYATAHGLSGKDTAVLFQEYGVLQYLHEFYDVLHGQGKDWLIQNIENYLENREKK